MNSKHELWIAFDRGYRTGMSGITVLGDATDKANTYPQLRTALENRIRNARRNFHAVITEEHPHRQAYMADCIGEITACKRWLSRITATNCHQCGRALTQHDDAPHCNRCRGYSL